MRVQILAIAGIAVTSIAMSACGSTATNTNMNVNARNMNSNVAVVVNNNSNMANMNMSNSNRMNANVNRADYDKNRADYEKDKGSSTIGQGANDSWIWFKTRAALLSTDELSESDINVDVTNNVVTLRGTVPTAADKAAAVKTAKAIEGVTNVTDQLKIAPDGSSNMSGGNSNMNRR
ncbi:MAG: BON domain-containing protein [Pyrinomonadaceae bacterium]